MSPLQSAALARLFSPSVLSELAKAGRSPLFARLLEEASLLNGFAGATVGAFFDYALDLLKKRQNRQEYVYRAAITEKILLGTHSLRTASMLTEFRIGQCKADVVILNGTGTVYEIKSERDSLARLARQLDAYRTVFPVVNVIVGENHVEDVLSSVDATVGIMQLSDRYRISTIRLASSDFRHLSSLCIFQSLALREARLVLRALGVSVPEVPNTREYNVLEEAFSGASPLEVHRAAVRVLKKARSLASVGELVDTLPKSLHPFVLSARLRKQDYGRIVEAISTSIDVARRWGQDGLPPIHSWQTVRAGRNS